MPDPVRLVRRWQEAGLLDADLAARILEFERGRAAPAGPGMAARIALAFGGLLVGAGVLLFVSASWDVLSPALRTTLVLVMVAAFHVAGALASAKSEAAATALHAVGTVAAGAGIFLIGQIYNLDEHWPSGVMLWAFAAWLGWAVRRDWPQLALAAILTPAWLAGEWSVLGHSYILWRSAVPESGIFLLALAYLTAREVKRAPAFEKVLRPLGAIVFIPVAVTLGFFAAAPIGEVSWSRGLATAPVTIVAAGWAVAIGVPSLLAAWSRGTASWMNAAAVLWTVALCNLPAGGGRLLVYLWLAVGSVGVAAWGVFERRATQVNLATVCFAITVMVFYFDSFASRMGRSAGLAGLGVLFLVGGYLLERARKRMIFEVRGGAE